MTSPFDSLPLENLNPALPVTLADLESLDDRRDWDTEIGGYADQRYDQHDDDHDNRPGRKGAADKPTQGQVLTDLARARYRFGVDQTGRAHGAPLEGPNVAQGLKGQGQTVRTALQAMYLQQEGKPASSGSITDALGALEGLALSTEPERVALRVGRDIDGGVVIDLGDTIGRAVVVTPGAWHFAARSPVLFRRTSAMLALPDPTPNTTALTQFQALTNVAPADWGLLIGFLVAALIPEIPHPILALTGEAGTAKTTVTRWVSALIDPSGAQVRAMPKTIDDWQVAASASWVVALDNLSRIDDRMSDALCRACTGDGLVKRALYSDSDVSVVAFRRVVMMNSIDVGSLRGDLGDRLVSVELEPITTRRAEADLELSYRALAPHVLGRLLGLLSQVLEVLPTTPTPTDLRMADFAQVLCALDTVTGWRTLARYREVSAATLARLVDGDQFAMAVRALVGRHDGHWSGSATDLREALVANAGDRAPWLPTTPNGVAGALKRCSPSLRAAGIAVITGRTMHGRTIDISRSMTTNDAK